MEKCRSLFSWGVSFEPYKNLYSKLFHQKILNILKFLMPLRGFLVIQDQNNSSELLLMLDYGIFYEFIPVNGLENEIVSLADVELNTNYEMVITTNSGLWRYRIGDTIKFTCLNLQGKSYR